MFDIGLTEVLLISVISLLVAGPERIPDIVRTLARTYRRIKKAVSLLKQEFGKEIGAEDIHQQLRLESVKEQYTDSCKQLEALDQQLQSPNIQFMEDLLSGKEDQKQNKYERAD